jgi:hypothetical protein
MEGTDEVSSIFAIKGIDSNASTFMEALVESCSPKLSFFNGFNSGDRL